MSKIKRIKKERKFFRREFKPVFLSFGLLIILIVGLVYIFNRKPDITADTKLENTLATEEITVGSSSDYCENYNIDDMRREANKVVLTYGIEENVVVGQAEDTDVVIDGTEPDLIDMYGTALKVNIIGLTENLKIKIMEHNADKNSDKYDDVLDTVKEFTQYDADEKGIVTYTKTNINRLTHITVRIYMKDPLCNNLLLREFESILPRVNNLVEHPVCQHELFKDSDDCQKVVFYNADIDDEMDDIDRMTKKIKQQEEDKNKESDKKNKIDVRVIYVLAVIPVIIAVVLIMKGRRKHGKKSN